MARQIVLWLAVIVIGGVLGANVYSSAVDARNWGSNIPASLNAARQYFSAANPGTFFRVASPLAQVLSLLALVLCWNVPGARLFAGVAVAANVTGDMMTFAYFYPRNDIMFINPMDAGAAARAWREWAAMNHMRSAIVLTALLAELATLTRVAQITAGAVGTGSA
jgi:uncharacterized membrane protein